MENSTTESVPARPKRLHPLIILAAFAVLIGFLGLIAWGLNRSMQGPIRVGDKVPDIQMVTFDGQPIKTSDLSGKVVVLNFWASWCKPCEQEAASLEEAYQSFKAGGKVEFIGLAYVDTEPNSRAYLQKFGITYANGPDLRTAVSQMFHITGVPETYIIGPDGHLAYAKIGPFASTDEIVSIIQPLIK